MKYVYQEKPGTSNLYRTKDFYQACILKSLGFELLNLERTEGNFCYFIFDDSTLKAEDTVKDYWNRSLAIEPRAMVDSINELKTRLYSDR